MYTNHAMSDNRLTGDAPRQGLTGVYDSTNTTRKAGFAYDALGRRIEFANP